MKRQTALALTVAAILISAALWMDRSFADTVGPACVPGTLDPSFNGNGIVTTSFGRNSGATAVIIQPDGRIIAAGSVCAEPSGHCDFWNSKQNFALARYNPDGTLDNSFGLNGKVTTWITNIDTAASVALQSDGRIVAAGSTSEDGSKAKFGVVRYNTDGALDSSFGVDGKVATSFPNGRYDYAQSIAIQPDGRIVVAGHTNTDYNNGQWGIGVVRYNRDGTLDSSFGSGGTVVTRINNQNCEAHAVAIQSDGKIVAAAQAVGLVGPEREFGVVRYNADGSLDNSFGNHGTVTTAISERQDEAQSVAIQSDGKIVVSGYSDIGIYNNYDFSLVRYNPNGTLDTSFGTGGKVTTDMGSGADSGHTVAIGPDGKIVLTGNTGRCCYYDGAGLARYDPDGSLDTSFNGTGKVITIVGRSNNSYSVAVQRDGRIVIAGASSPAASVGDFTLIRYYGDCASLSPFDYDGDGRADVSVFRPPTDAWYLLESTAGFTGVSFGNSTDNIAPADFDGDGKTDVAVYRPSSGTWYWLNSSDGAFNAAQFGSAEDLPTPADYDGDGRADLSVFRPSNGVWYRLNSHDGSFLACSVARIGFDIG